MPVKPRQPVTVTGPDGKSHRGRVLHVYRSTGGIVSVWIDLGGDYVANPANQPAGEWPSSVLVLRERDGEYRDLWLHPWRVMVVDEG